VSEHVQQTVASCAQGLYAHEILRAHGLPGAAMHQIYCSRVLAKQTYAASVWWCFASQSDSQRVSPLLKRGVNCDVCPVDVSRFVELCEAADRKLSETIFAKNMYLHQLLPAVSNSPEHYTLRSRAHDKQIPERGFYICYESY
jgi:hypothetical protein